MALLELVQWWAAWVGGRETRRQGRSASLTPLRETKPSRCDSTPTLTNREDFSDETATGGSESEMKAWARFCREVRWGGIAPPQQEQLQGF